MANIYSGSYLTISALESENCESGVFQPRSYQSISLPVSDSSKIFECNEDKNEQLFIRNALEIPERIIRDSAWSGRGWTFQEWILSPRVIHFAKEQLIWECYDSCFTEGGYSFTTRNDESPTPIRLASAKLKPDLNLPLIHNKTSLGKEIWYLAVEEFTRRRLSFESDKLPAILGIAKQYSAYDAGDYVAGLWKSDLINGLLWRPYNGLEVRVWQSLTKSKQWRAPTWSWAAYEGGVEYYCEWCYGFSERTDFASIMVLQANLDSLYAQERLNSARVDRKSLKRGLTPTMKIKAPTARSRYAHNPEHDPEYTPNLDTHILSFLDWGCSVSFYPNMSPKEAFNCTCLLLFRCSLAFCFLVVSETEQKDVFERVGVADYDDHDKKAPFMKAYPKTSDESYEHHLPEEEILLA